MTAYYFTTSGIISRIPLPYKTLDEIGAKDINPTYKSEGFYMLSVKDNYFLLLHNDNDINLASSTLPFNQSLKIYYPNSPFKGDILLVKLDSRDNLRNNFSIADAFKNLRLVKIDNEYFFRE